MSRLTRDGTAEPISRNQTLRHVRGQRNIRFPGSADHEQDCQIYPVDPVVMEGRRGFITAWRKEEVDTARHR